MEAPAWLGGVLPAPGRGLGGERVLPFEAVQQAVQMADAALKAKTRAAQRHAMAAASLGFQKGVAASHAAVTQQARCVRCGVGLHACERAHARCARGVLRVRVRERGRIRCRWLSRRQSRACCAAGAPLPRAARAAGRTRTRCAPGAQPLAPRALLLRCTRRTHSPRT
jgi:hypothetical protein